MIREYKRSDEKRVLNIYYAASKIAHNFIPDKLLRNDVKVVKEQYLPFAEIYVYEENNLVVGHIALVEGAFIGGFFVDPKYQGKGIGNKLLEYVKNKYNILELHVFQKNIKTVEFYKKNGFIIVGEIKEGHLGYPEWHMKWKVVG